MSLDQPSSSRNIPASEARSIDLPLIDYPNSDLWAETSLAAPDRSVWPALTDALSATGRQRLWEALRMAVDATPGDPDQALMVVEAFWRTMQIRRGPNYERRVHRAAEARGRAEEKRGR